MDETSGFGAGRSVEHDVNKYIAGDEPALQRGPRSTKIDLAKMAYQRDDITPGTRIEHRKFGSGTVALCDGDRIEVDFKRYGRRKLVIAIAASEMTITSANKQSSMLGDTIPGKIGGYTAQDWHQGDWEREMTRPNTPLHRRGRR